MPLATYVDLETATQTDSCLNPEDKKMFAVSYVVIFAFHPELKLERLITQQSYRHLLDKLLTVDYLTGNQINFTNFKKILQLRDAVVAVADRRDKLAISTIFNIELKFASDTLLKWFNIKH